MATRKDIQILVRENARELIVIALLAAVLVVYGQSARFMCVQLDDGGYIANNPQVLQGLTPANIKWAFTTFCMGNWHPLTWLSHMLDTQFRFGPGPRHLVNVLLHAINTGLLFLLLHRMTGRLGRSALVAALFALHPLHVESVAWLSSRKDVLSFLFGMLALLAYDAYAKRKAAGAAGIRLAYGLALAAMALSLMAKPLFVTLPCLMVLLDGWPLRRFIPASTAPGAMARAAWPLLWEKAPFFALTVGSSIMTALSQRHGQAVVSLDWLPLPIRMFNAVNAYGAYAWKTLFPYPLYVPYLGHFHALTLGSVALPLLALTAITAVAAVLVRRAPYLLTGWLWFLGTLVPMIGLVQVGTQTMADRYTYLPLVGLFVMAVWAAADLTARAPRVQTVAAAAMVLAVLPALMAMSYRQASYWRDDLTLFGHTLQYDATNLFAVDNYGSALINRGYAKEAAAHYAQAIGRGVDNVDITNNYGAALLLSGQPAKAAEAFRKVLQRKPGDPTVYSNLGAAYYQMNRPADARRYLNEALQRDPRCENALRVLQRLEAGQK